MDTLRQKGPEVGTQLAVADARREALHSLDIMRDHLEAAKSSAFLDPSDVTFQRIDLLEQGIRQGEELVSNEAKVVVVGIDLTGSMSAGELRQAKQALRQIVKEYKEEMVYAFAFGDAAYDKPFVRKIDLNDLDALGNMRMGGGSNDSESPLAALLQFTETEGLVQSSKRSMRQEMEGLGKVVAIVISDEHADGVLKDNTTLPSEAKIEFNSGKRSTDPDVLETLKALRNKGIVLHAITPEKNTEGGYDLQYLGFAWAAFADTWTELGKTLDLTQYKRATYGETITKVAAGYAESARGAYAQVTALTVI